ncbi:MAG: hypothetical protein ABFS32_05985 [Bacteroidota bacterium]
MQYKLRLLNLKCYLSDESDGDEIFLKSEGKRIWPTDKKYKTITEEITPLKLEFDVEKGAKMPIDIWDYDVLSANDHLGSLTITADAHGQYEVDFRKTGKDKSKYALEFEIG